MDGFQTDGEEDREMGVDVEDRDEAVTTHLEKLTAQVTLPV